MYARTRTSASKVAAPRGAALVECASGTSAVSSAAADVAAADVAAADVAAVDAVAAAPAVRVERRTRGAAFAGTGSALTALVALRRAFGVALSDASVGAGLDALFVRAAFGEVVADDLSVFFLGFSPGAAEIGRGSGWSFFAGMEKSVVVRWDGYAVTILGAAREGSPHPNALRAFFVPCHVCRRLLIVVTNAAGVVERARNHAHTS